MFDGDPSEGNQSKMNYSNSFVKDFILERKPEQYEFSDIDMTKRRIPMEKDYFTLWNFRLNGIQFQYALSKSYTVSQRFMGQTTAFDAP
jgi:hypothetical protein